MQKMIDRYRYENILWNEGYSRVMGLDEVGRGCLCGPVVAAGVILKPGAKLSFEAKDSKKISKKNREEFTDRIKEESEFWTIKTCSPKEIDELNILHASIKAMLKCAEYNGAEPDYLLVDGNRFTSTILPYECVVKGDDKSASIAAASILAKVYRDKLMESLHKELPYYGWNRNVGYPTKDHFEGLEKYGYTKYHRQSFKLRTDKEFSLPVDTE